MNGSALYKTYIKRLIDVVLSLIVLTVCSPFLLVTMCCLVVVNGGKPFFFQKRPGKNEKTFLLIKFKTMTDARDNEGRLLPDADRITSIGRFVRASSMDELPQMINVLKGDMSLIGPRPLLIKYLPLYTSEQARRHEVRPGITGWAQVNGRNAISWAKKFELDVWYVDHVSFRLDLKIFWLTIRKVLKREGISAEGQATTEAFNGNN